MLSSGNSFTQRLIYLMSILQSARLFTFTAFSTRGKRLGKIESVKRAARDGSSLGALRKCLSVLMVDFLMVVENLKEVYFVTIGSNPCTI